LRVLKFDGVCRGNRWLLRFNVWLSWLLLWVKIKDPLAYNHSKIMLKAQDNQSNTLTHNNNQLNHTLNLKNHLLPMQTQSSFKTLNPINNQLPKQHQLINKIQQEHGVLQKTQNTQKIVWISLKLIHKKEVKEKVMLIQVMLIIQ